MEFVHELACGACGITMSHDCSGPSVLIRLVGMTVVDIYETRQGDMVLHFQDKATGSQAADPPTITLGRQRANQPASTNETAEPATAASSHTLEEDWAMAHHPTTGVLLHTSDADDSDISYDSQSGLPNPKTCF